MNKRPVIVGFFILVGLAILVVTVFTLGGQKKTFAKSFTLNAVFDDVAGLQKGNNIWFSGVKVGTIKNISFSKNTQVLVEMNVDQELQQHIRKDAKAKISTDGLIGNKIVVIYGGTSNAPIIASGAYLAVEKMISTDEMLATFQKNNVNLLAVTTNFKEISDNILHGKGSVSRLLNDPELANRLNTVVTNFNRVALNSERFSKSLDDYGIKLNTQGNFANDLATDTIMINSLRGTVTQLREAAYEASAITNNLSRASEQLNNRGTPVGAILNDSLTGEALKNTILNLESGTKKLDEDLEALQHNFLLRGFFKNKRKQEEEEQKKLQQQQQQPK